MLGIKPKLNELQFLKFPDGNALRIIDTVAPKWKQVAIALGFDGPKIKAIEMGAHYQPGDACLKMFIDWLSRGRALTWDSLIQSLRAANLTETADLLSSTIEIVSVHILNTTYYEMYIICSPLIFYNIQGAEDEVDSTLSAVVLDSESSSTVTPDVIVGNVKGIQISCYNDSQSVNVLSLAFIIVSAKNLACMYIQLNLQNVRMTSPSKLTCA